MRRRYCAGRANGRRRSGICADLLSCGYATGTQRGTKCASVRPLTSEGLANALSMLDKRSRRIVKARWLDIEDDGSGGATLHELADEFGVSAERIRHIIFNCAT